VERAQASNNSVFKRRLSLSGAMSVNQSDLASVNIFLLDIGLAATRLAPDTAGMAKRFSHREPAPLLLSPAERNRS
jgi:hypothetical protein